MNPRGLRLVLLGAAFFAVLVLLVDLATTTDRERIETALDEAKVAFEAEDAEGLLRCIDAEAFRGRGIERGRVAEVLATFFRDVEKIEVWEISRDVEVNGDAATVRVAAFVKAKVPGFGEAGERGRYRLTLAARGAGGAREWRIVTLEKEEDSVGAK